MDYIKQWALGLVLTSVIGTVVLVLSPSGTMEKQVRLAVSLVILVMFVSPLFSLSDLKQDQFSAEANFKENMSNNAEEYFTGVFENELNEKIISLVEAEGIEVAETKIDVSVKNENEISVESVVVYILDKDKSSEVKSLIENEYGIIAEVEVSD